MAEEKEHTCAFCREQFPENLLLPSASVGVYICPECTIHNYAEILKTKMPAIFRYLLGENLEQKINTLENEINKALQKYRGLTAKTEKFSLLMHIFQLQTSLKETLAELEQRMERLENIHKNMGRISENTSIMLGFRIGTLRLLSESLEKHLKKLSEET